MQRKSEKIELSFLENLAAIDVLLSTFIHKHESVMLTVLLFIPAVLFNPKVIIFPISLITYLYGPIIGLKYLCCVGLGLLFSTFLKRRIGRPRPPFQDQLLLKPMILRKAERNFSMPSGDSVQAGVFLFWFLINSDNEKFDLNQVAVILSMINVLLGRVYFCCHYFCDTFVGFILGILVSSIIYQLLPNQL